MSFLSIFAGACIDSLAYVYLAHAHRWRLYFGGGVFRSRMYFAKLNKRRPRQKLGWSSMRVARRAPE